MPYSNSCISFLKLCMFREFEEFCESYTTCFYLEGKPRNCRALASAYSSNQCNTVQSSARHESYTYISTFVSFQLSPRLTLCSECNKSAPAGSIAASKSDSQQPSFVFFAFRLHSCWCYWAQFLGWTYGVCDATPVWVEYDVVFLASNRLFKEFVRKEMWRQFCVLVY